MCRVIALARSSRRVIWLPVCLGLVMGVGGYSATRGAVAFGDPALYVQCLVYAAVFCLVFPLLFSLQERFKERCVERTGEPGAEPSAGTVETVAETRSGDARRTASCVGAVRACAACAEPAA